MIKVTRFAAGDDVELADFLAERSCLLAPLAADEIVGRAVQEVHRNEREKLRRPALQEEHIVRIADSQKLFAEGNRLIIDGFEFLPAMAHLGDAKPLPLIIQQGGG